MAFSNQSIISVFEDVCNDLKTTGTYTGVFASGYTVCTGANTFKAREVVNINNVSYIITEATDTTFKVKGDVSAFTTYESAYPYFLYGHILEISNTLKAKNSGIGTLKYQKYPLIILQLDVESKYDGLNKSFEYRNINIFICNITNKTYRAKDRLEHNFNNVLYPLYEAFVTKLSRHEDIIASNNANNFEHTKIDRFFWGSQENGNSTNNIFEDYSDAIEIKNLQLNIKNKKCI